MSEFVRPSVEGDVYQLYERLRDEDLLDLSLTKTNPTAALLHGLGCALCFTVVIDDMPEAMFGLEMGSEYVAPWLLGTSELTTCGGFLRQGRLWWDLFKKVAGRRPMMNELHRDNTLHRRWLEWLGCEIRDDGDESLTFYYV